MAKKPTGTPLAGKNVSDAEAIGSVIRLRSQLEAARREIIALRKDRDDLLDEHVDLRKARTPHVLKPNRPAPRKDDFVRVSCGDVHGMMRSKRAVEAFLGDLAQWSPDEIVLGGDILECGGWLAKHQPIGFVALCDYSYQEDVAAANQFLDEVQKRAPKARLHYLEGNHEARVERWIVDQTMAHKRDAEFLRAMCAPEVVLGLKERGIPYYRMSEEHLTGLPRGWVKFGKLHYTHALGTSKNAARAAAERTAGNVVFFHTHREDTATLVLPGVGIVKAFNPGCLCSRQPVWKNSDPTNWSHGYGVEFVAKSGDFLRLHIPIWEGRSLIGSMMKTVKG